MVRRRNARLAGLPVQHSRAAWPYPRNFRFGQPIIDFLEHPEAFQIVAELPVITMHDIDPSFEDRTLTIRDGRQMERKVEGRLYL